eukprot:scaffold10176_cov83-Skeletonema_dohrnii-CCMP3373.AAC.4
MTSYQTGGTTYRGEYKTAHKIYVHVGSFERSLKLQSADSYAIIDKYDGPGHCDSVVVNLWNENVEAEPLTGNGSTSITTSTTTPSWKKYGMGAALLALVGYVAINSSSPFQNAVSTDVPSSHYSVVPTLGHGHHAKKSEEEETELFDERRRFIVRDFDSRSTFSNFLPGVA